MAVGATKPLRLVLVAFLLGPCRFEPAFAQDNPTALTVAICVTAEVGPALPARSPQRKLRKQEQVTVMWSLHNWWLVRRRREDDLTLADHAREYCNIFRSKSAQARRPWLLELNEAGDKPPSWSERRERMRWEAYRPRWLETLQEVRDWLGPCEGPEPIHHWNDPSSEPKGTMQRAACDGYFAAVNRTRFYTVPSR